MEIIFKYAILVASPDTRRGERVNVGIAVFCNDRIDVRFSNISKLAALRSYNWIEYSVHVNELIGKLYEPSMPPAEFVNRFAMCEPIITLSELAWFSVRQPEDYENRISDILEALVLRPHSEPRPRVTKINTEIARVFRTAKLLAKPTESQLNDHKVHPNYLISNQEELRADFVQKNGVYNVTATLDLRKTNIDLGDAALGAVVLDKAAKHFGRRKTKKWGVIAAPIGSSEYKSEIELFSDYADKVYNWMNPDDQRAYTRMIFAGAAQPNPLGII